MLGFDSLPDPSEDLPGAIDAGWIAGDYVPIDARFLGLGQDGELDSDRLVRDKSLSQFSVEQELFGLIVGLVLAPAATGRW